METEKQVVVRFAPNCWGEVDRFRLFWGQTTTLRDDEREVLAGVSNHFHKAIRLLNVAQIISPNLEEDATELKLRGFTNATRAAEFTAVVESALTALYSSLDCTRKILNIIYPKAQGLPNSTRKLFQNAANGKLGNTIPQTIRDALANAEWFRTLRIVRDALTHTNTGMCHRYQDTGAIRYFNDVLKPICNQAYIDDFIAFVTELKDQVNTLLGQIFHELNQNMENAETWQMCGIFYGRVYHRFVRPTEAVDFNSGRCGAYKWFELEENPTCPFINSCGAYLRKTDC